MSEGYGQATGVNDGWLRRKLPLAKLFSLGGIISGMDIATAEVCKKVRLWGVSSLLNVQIHAGIIRIEGQTPYTRETLPALPGTVMCRPFNEWPNQPINYLKPLTLVPQNIPHTFQLGPGLDTSEPSGNRNGVAMCDGVEIEVCVDPDEYFSTTPDFEEGPFESTISLSDTDPQYFEIGGTVSVPVSPGFIPAAGTLTSFTFNIPASIPVGMFVQLLKNDVPLGGGWATFVPAGGPYGPVTLVGFEDFNGTTDTLDMVVTVESAEEGDTEITGTAFFAGATVASGILGDLVVQVQADYIGAWWDRKLVERLISNLRLETVSSTNIITINE